MGKYGHSSENMDSMDSMAVSGAFVLLRLVYNSRTMMPVAAEEWKSVWAALPAPGLTVVWHCVGEADGQTAC